MLAEALRVLQFAHVEQASTATTVGGHLVQEQKIAFYIPANAVLLRLSLFARTAEGKCLPARGCP